MDEIATREGVVGEVLPAGALTPCLATVLLVEDEQFVREGTSEALRSAGYSVLTARSAAEAGQLYRKCEDIVDLLLTDVVLPGESGRELGQRFQCWNQRLKILFMSGYAEQIAGSDSRREEFLAKPFSAAVLLQRVADVLQKGKE